MSKVNNSSGKTVVVYDEDKISQAEIKKLVEKVGDYKVVKDNNELSNISSSSIDKKDFFFGLITSLAIVAVIGFLIMLKLYLYAR